MDIIGQTERTLAGLEERLRKAEHFLRLLREVKLPRTIDDFDCTMAVPITDHWFDLHLVAKAGVDPQLAYGTVAKVAAALAAAGWDTAKGMKLHAEGTRMVASLEVFMPYAGRRLQLDIDFYEMPEGPLCRLVEEEVLVPAVPEHVEKRLKVVCEEQEQLATPTREVARVD